MNKTNTNKTVLITGASKGIGKATAILLAKNNFNLILWARNKTELENLQTDLSQYEINIWINVVDISNKNQIITAIQFIENQQISIDYVINNAGIGMFKTIENTEEDDWDLQMNTNAKGSFLVTKYTLPFLKKQKQGIIIFVASDAGKRTFENGGAYCASKFAQIALANVLRAEVRNDNIRVSVICAGLTDTHFNNSEQGTKPHYLSPFEVADTILYILNSPNNVMIDEITLHPKTQVY